MTLCNIFSAFLRDGGWVTGVKTAPAPLRPLTAVTDTKLPAFSMLLIKLYKWSKSDAALFLHGTVQWPFKIFFHLFLKSIYAFILSIASGVKVASIWRSAPLNIAIFDMYLEAATSIQYTWMTHGTHVCKQEAQRRSSARFSFSVTNYRDCI